MKKAAGILLFALVLLLLLPVSADSLIGSATHMGELHDDGRLELYGCNDHGECGPNGYTDVKQAELLDHRTVILHTDGRVTLHGAFPDSSMAEAETWQDIREICVSDFCLFAIRNDGSMAWCGDPGAGNGTDDPDGPEPGLSLIPEISNAAQFITTDDDLPFVCFSLSDGTVVILNPRDNWNVLKTATGIDWSEYQKVRITKTNGWDDAVKRFDLYALSGDGTLLKYSSEEGCSAVSENAEDFCCSNGRLCIRDGGRSDPGSDLYDSYEVTKIACMDDTAFVALSGSNTLIIRSNGFELGEQLRKGIRNNHRNMQEIWEDIDYYRGRIILRDGPFFVSAYKSGELYTFSSVDADGQTESLSPRGTARQLELRSLRGRVSWPFALKEDGTVLWLGEGEPDSACRAVLEWTGIRCISVGQLGTVAAVTEDGRVLTAAISELPEDAEDHCRETEGWTGVAAVTVYGSHIAAVTDDGHVLLAGKRPANEPDLSRWTNVVDVAMTGIYTWDPGNDYNYDLIGLKNDGTILGATLNLDRCISVAGGDYDLYFIREDGTCLSFGFVWSTKYVERGIMTGILQAAVSPAGIGEMGSPHFLRSDGYVYEDSETDYLRAYFGGENIVAVWPGPGLYAMDAPECFALDAGGILHSGEEGRQWDLNP